jgi:hypothetical protein
MKQKVWNKIKKLEDKDDFGAELELGDVFLYGTRMAEQQQVKKIGDGITYFAVIRKNGKNVEYTQVFDVLEKDSKEEEK